MIDNKKEQERAELHRTIWGIANDLRGSVDGWDFKNYVLVMLFYRYISENLTNYINAGEIEAGAPDFDYTKLSDDEAETAREDMVQTKGFFILPSQLFCNVLQRADTDENLNETLEGIFRSIEGSAQGCESEDDFKGLFDDFDVNSNKLGGTVAKRNERLVKLMNGVASMQLGDYQENTIDHRRRDKRVLRLPQSQRSERHKLSAAPFAPAPCIQVGDEKTYHSDKSRRSG